MGQNRYEHMHVIGRQHAFFNVHAKFLTRLADNFADTFSHQAAQSLVTIFCCPNHVKSVINLVWLLKT